uniref:Uncharacterized protein n=1 Tax=Rhizophora mucronata TaxID=61149 RepID=A0A2P2NYR9_RHIMU
MLQALIYVLLKYNLVVCFACLDLCKIAILQLLSLLKWK